MLIQVVKPSVSLAAVLQGTAFTISVEIPSFPTLDSPVVEFGNRGLPGAGGAPVGAGTAIGGGGKALVRCLLRKATWILQMSASPPREKLIDAWEASPRIAQPLRQRRNLFD